MKTLILWNEDLYTFNEDYTWKGPDATIVKELNALSLMRLQEYRTGLGSPRSIIFNEVQKLYLAKVVVDDEPKGRSTYGEVH